MTATLEATHGSPPDDVTPPPARRWSGWQVAALLPLAAGLVLRFWPRSALWLDEAQSVAFARLPVDRIPDALREDGAPPLYYVILHGWMRLFGDGDTTVRALSGLFSIGAVIVVAVLARRIAGTTAAWAVAVMMATNPFAIRYATETRMYGLVTLEVALLALAIHTCIRRNGGWRAHACVAVCAGALLYTHYWSLYLLGGLICLAAVLSCWPRAAAAADARRRSRRIGLALVAGFVLWLPWLPNFNFQRTHTGTPWAHASVRGLLPRSAREGVALAVLGYGLFLAAALLAAWLAVVRRRRHVDRDAARLVFAAIVVGGAFAWLGATMSNSALVIRYTSVFFPLVALLIAIGVAAVDDRRIVVGALAVVSLVSTGLAVKGVDADRTPARQFTAELERRAGPDDTIVYCPDQLGPAMSRLLTRHGSPLADRQVVFPAGGGLAGQVNWINYEERFANANAPSFARTLSSLNAESTIWLAWSGVYPPTQQACTSLFLSLRFLRPDHDEVIPEDFRDGDHGSLWRFDP